VIDHHEILSRAAGVVGRYQISADAQYLDRQAATIRQGIGLGLAGRVLKLDHGRVDGGLLKQSLRKFRGEIRQHPELPLGVAMRFDVHIGAKLAAPGPGPRENQFQCFNDPLDILRLIRRNRLDLV